MTTAALTAGPFSPQTRLRLTVRGRRVLAAAIALPLCAGIAFGVLSGGGALATPDAPVSSTAFTTVTISEGDTLWAIAERVAPASDPRDVVYAIMNLNALDTAVLVAGDELAIPLEYGS